MAKLLNVRPGDLITAADMMLVVDALEALQDRVSQLEVSNIGSAVKIFGVSKTSVAVGDELTVTGANFGFTIGAHRVTLGDVPITGFRSGSSDSKLIFTVPNVLGAQTTEKVVALRVSNAFSSDSRSITVHPMQTPVVGTLDVAWKEAIPPTPASGDLYFRFTLTLDANQPVEVDLDAIVSKADWVSRLSILESQTSATPIKRVTLTPISATNPKGKDVFLKLAGIPAGLGNVPFTLTLNARGGGLFATSQPQSFTLNSAPEPPDPDITIGVPTIEPSSASSDNTTLSVPSSGSVTTTFEVNFAAVADYIVDAVITPAAGWTVVNKNVFTPPLGNAIPVTAAENPSSTNPVAKTLGYRITRGAGAAAAELVFNIHKSAVAAGTKRRFVLQLG